MTFSDTQDALDDLAAAADWAVVSIHDALRWLMGVYGERSGRNKPNIAKLTAESQIQKL